MKNLGRPQWKRTSLSTAVTLAIFAMQTPVFAACPGTISGAENTACTLTATESVTITNVGTLIVPGAHAINVNGAATGVTIDNSGTIEANTYAITVAIGATGTTITNRAGADIHADSTAILFGGDLDGTLTNSGSILADGDSTVYAVRIGGDLSGTLTNTSTGSITAAYTSSDSVEAYGVRIGGELSGALSNAGTISATAVTTDSETAEAYGIYVSGELSGTLTNTSTGVITATATNEYSSYATAYGIRVGNVTGTLTNAGSITATALNTEESSATAYGIRAGFVDATGAITNSGTITVSATNDVSEAEAYGIYINGLNGAFTNTSTGTIDVTASAAQSSVDAATGININGDIGASGSLTNNGTLNVTILAATDSATADGIHVSGDVVGSLSNGGDITVDVTGASGPAIARGVYLESFTVGSFINSGAITGVADDPADGYSIYLANGTGTFDNQAGGVLTGNLYTGGTIAVSNAGTVAIPTGVAGNVVGNYTQTASGVLDIGVASSAEHASLVVGGTANFAAGTGIHVSVEDTNTLAEGDEILDVVSAGSLSASSFTMTDNYALWNFTAAIDGNTVDLTTIPGLTILEAATIGGASSAAYGVAGALDAINAGTPSSDMSTVLASLNGMTETEIAAAAEQMMPVISGGVGHLTNQIAGVLPDAVDERLNSKRGMSSGDGMMSDHKAWVKPFGNWADQDDRKGVYGYDADSYGLSLGADADTGMGWRLGAAFAYSNGDVDSDASNFRHQLDMDTYQIGVYGAHQIDAATALDVKMAWGMSQYDTTRHIDFVSPARVAEGDFESWHLRLNAKISRDYSLDSATTVAPHLRADYAYVDVDSYTESGAGALNLDVQGDTEDAFVLGVGADMSHAARDNLSLKANLGVGYDLSADQSVLDASFLNDGPVFITQGLDPDPWVYRAGVGAVFLNSKDMEIAARYDVEGRQDYTNQGVSLNLRKSF